MSNARFTILQARAVKDKRITDSQFRTLAALGMYADEDGWCFPLLSTLGKDLSKSKQAVGRDTIALRKLGYLEVQARYDKNGSRRSSLYRLKYDLPPVNVDDSTPSTSGVDTPSTSGVDTPSTSGVDTPSTSGVDVNDPSNDLINMDDSFSKPAKTDETQGEYKLLENSDPAFLMANDQPITDEAQQARILEHNAITAFEASFSALRPLAWFSGKPKWTHLRRDVVELYKADPQCFEKYKVWRTTPYVKGAVSLKDIQRDPDCFIASWAGFVEANPKESESNKFEGGSAYV